jgi:hypothetical protein
MEGSTFVCFASLSHWHFSNHDASCHTLGTIGKHSVSKGGLSCFTMFQLTVEKLLNIETPPKKKKIPLKIHLNQN